MKNLQVPMTAYEFPTLETNRLKLRPFTQADTQALYEYRSDKEVARYQAYEPFTLQQTTDFIQEAQASGFGEAGNWLILAIEDKATGTLAGDICLMAHEWDTRTVEFGVNVSPKHQGKGIAREVMALIFNAMFNQIQAHRIVAYVDPANEPSARLMTSLGMRLEATFKKSFCKQGVWCDELFFAILEDEWALQQKIQNNSAPAQKQALKVIPARLTKLAV